MSCDFRLIDFNYVFASETEILPSSVSPDFPVSNLKNFSRAKTFRTSSVSGTQAVVFDLKTIEEIDSFMVFFNPLDEIKFSPAASIHLQASQTNVWVAPPVDVILSIDNENSVISHFFSTDQSYRYWRIKMVDPLNTWGYFELPKVVLGKKLPLTRVPETGFSYEIEDLSKSEETSYGHKYFDVYPNIKSLSFNYNAFTYENLETLSQSFERVGKVSPVVVVMDGSENLFDKDYFLIYGTYKESMKVSHMFRSYFKVPQTIEEFI